MFTVRREAGGQSAWTGRLAQWVWRYLETGPHAGSWTGKCGTAFWTCRHNGRKKRCGYAEHVAGLQAACPGQGRQTTLTGTAQCRMTFLFARRRLGGSAKGKIARTAGRAGKRQTRKSLQLCGNASAGRTGRRRTPASRLLKHTGAVDEGHTASLRGQMHPECTCGAG